MSVPERIEMITSNKKLSLRHQCELLDINRSSFYYRPVTESEENLKIMQMLDSQYFATPFYGKRRLHEWLKRQGYNVNKKRLHRLMEKVCLQTLYPKVRTTRTDAQVYKYPYLLKVLDITDRNQVWELDISYIPMQHGFMYLFGIIDVYSRFVVGWGLSNTMSSRWCCSVISDAISTYGCPEIINSDHGVQFTSKEYITLLNDEGIRNSMDSRGRALDDIYIERLWRSVKQEYVYLSPCEQVKELWKGLSAYFDFYNYQCPHQSLAYRYPAEIYRQSKPA